MQSRRPSWHRNVLVFSIIDQLLLDRIGTHCRCLYGVDLCLGEGICEGLEQLVMKHKGKQKVDLG